MRYILVISLLLFSKSIFSFAQNPHNDEGAGINSYSYQLKTLRDSLDAIQYAMPSMPKIEGKWTVVKVRKQKDWDEIVPTMKALLDAGQRNIEVRITGKNIVFGQEQKVAQGWNYPDANLRLVGKKAKMIPYGYSFSRSDAGVKREGEFYTLPYTEFNLNDIVIDSKGNEIPLREEVKQVTGDIVRVQGFNPSTRSGVGSKVQDVWKFEIDLPNLSEEQCKDFYVLITRDWTACRHRVIMVKDGYLYFKLPSDDAPSDYQNKLDPNKDWKTYGVRPRYCLINNPIGQGLHFIDGRVYIPANYKSIRICKDARLFQFNNCTLKSLSIEGFKVSGAGSISLIYLYNNKFVSGAWIKDNTISNISGLAVTVYGCENTCIANNVIENTRLGAITCGGKNNTVLNNRLRNIGWMLNTRAIVGGGTRLHIVGNTIEDFNYSAIACGSTTANEKASPLEYIIERNTIRYSQSFAENYLFHTQGDGGAIYIGPQNTRGIIRNNFIENYKGIGSNRGIFLDDGGKNLAIYGNYIKGVSNSYDIDLRYCTTYSQGIPDHNTNNLVFMNILTGYYRFEGRQEEDNCVVGENILLNGVNEGKNKLRVRRKSDDVVLDKSGGRKGIGGTPVDSFIKDKF